MLSVAAFRRGGADRLASGLHRWGFPASLPLAWRLVDATAARRRYSVHAGYGSWQALETVAVPQPYGGRRWYARCPAPGCGRLCAALFWRSVGAEGACRRCAGVVYHTTQLGRAERLLFSLDQCARRLGGLRDRGELPPRPRGMHRRTYARLAARYQRAEIALLREWHADLDQFLQGVESAA